MWVLCLVVGTLMQSFPLEIMRNLIPKKIFGSRREEVEKLIWEQQSGVSIELSIHCHHPSVKGSLWLCSGWLWLQNLLPRKLVGGDSVPRLVPSAGVQCGQFTLVEPQGDTRCFSHASLLVASQGILILGCPGSWS